MKRSRSTTKSSRASSRKVRKGEPKDRKGAIRLALALLAVLAFLASFFFGLDRNPDQRPAPSQQPTPTPAAVPDSRVRVEVLNGSGKTGLARFATDQLRDAGYDVVHLGNASSAAKTSVVIDRVGKREIANRVAQALQIATVETQVDTSRYLEVTVILGKDWAAAHQPRN